MPPLTAGVPGNTAMDANAQGGAPAAGGDQPQGQGQGQGGPDLNAMIGQLRQAAAPLQELLGQMPFLSAQQNALKKLLKEAVTGIAAKAPKQTPSAGALP